MRYEITLFVQLRGKVNRILNAPVGFMPTNIPSHCITFDSKET